MFSSSKDSFWSSPRIDADVGFHRCQCSFEASDGALARVPAGLELLVRALTLEVLPGAQLCKLAEGIRIAREPVDRLRASAVPIGPPMLRRHLQLRSVGGGHPENDLCHDSPPCCTSERSVHPPVTDRAGERLTKDVGPIGLRYPAPCNLPAIIALRYIRATSDDATPATCFRTGVCFASAALPLRWLVVHLIRLCHGLAMRTDSSVSAYAQRIKVQFP